MIYFLVVHFCVCVRKKWVNESNKKAFPSSSIKCERNEGFFPNRWKNQNKILEGNSYGFGSLTGHHWSNTKNVCLCLCFLCLNVCVCVFVFVLSVFKCVCVCLCLCFLCLNVLVCLAVFVCLWLILSFMFVCVRVILAI